MIVIGSQALKVVRPDLLNHEPRDLDFIGEEGEFHLFIETLHQITPIEGIWPISGGRKYMVRPAFGLPIEFEIAWVGSSAAQVLNLIRMFEAWACVPAKQDPKIPLSAHTWNPNLDVLFAFKTTHRFAPTKNFRKTLHDWHRMKEAGAKIPPTLEQWVETRSQETLKRKHPKLNVTREQFFDPTQVAYMYDHDSIHRAVAYLTRPAYTYFQKPGDEVKCSRAMFEAAPYSQRLHSVAEEAYVLAIERSHVPHGKLTPRQAFDHALERVCTNISSGWWREFAYRNFFEVENIYRDDYLQRFHAALTAGKIPLFQGSKYGSNQTV